MRMTYEIAAARIEQSNYKMTKARSVMLKAILRMKDVFTAQKLTSKCQGVDLATVYRNLPVFEELGLICKTDFSDEVSRYIANREGHGGHHHHHIICRRCERIVAVDFCIVKAQEQLLAKLGFKEIKHRLEFSGVCKSCA